MPMSPAVLRRPIALMLLATLVTAALPLSADASSLTNQIRNLLDATDLGTTRPAISVREAGSGRTIVDIEADRSMIPASNMKILTTGAALHLLGADFRFGTRLLLDERTLYIVGDGDPGLGDPELLRHMGDSSAGGLDIEDLIAVWTDAISKAGIAELDAIIVDDRVFDREFVHPSWPADQLNRAYCAQVAGVNMHLNVLYFFPEPAASGRPVIGESVPRAPWITPANRGTTERGNSGANTAWIGRRLGSNQITLYGSVRHAYRVPVAVTIDNPPRFAGDLLAHRLRERGIRIAEDAVHVAAEDAPPPRGTLAAPPIKTPLAVAIRRTNTDSQNMYAEAMIKRIGNARTGRPGSWSDGAAMVRLAIHERVNEPALLESLVVADGSGLSRDNRVSPALMTRWMDTLISDPEVSEIFLDSLAEGGRTGTLRDRMHHGALRTAVVQAKTGYIRGVSCVSGVVTASGERRLFSIMFNSMNASNARAKDVQDRIVELIVRDMVNTALPLGSD